MRDFLYRLDCILCVLLLRVLGVLRGSKPSPQWFESALVGRCSSSVWSVRRGL